MPSSEQVKSCAGRMPWKQVASDSSVTLMRRCGAPAPGPGVWLKMRVGAQANRDGRPGDPRPRRGARDADLLEAAEKPSHCAGDERPFVLGGVARADEQPLHLAGAVVDRPAESHRRLAVRLEVRQDPRRRDRRHVDDQVRAVRFHLHGDRPRAVGLAGPRSASRYGSPRPPGGRRPARVSIIGKITSISAFKDFLGSVQVLLRRP